MCPLRARAPKVRVGASPPSARVAFCFSRVQRRMSFARSTMTFCRKRMQRLTEHLANRRSSPNLSLRRTRFRSGRRPCEANSRARGRHKSAGSATSSRRGTCPEGPRRSLATTGRLRGRERLRRTEFVVPDERSSRLKGVARLKKRCTVDSSAMWTGEGRKGENWIKTDEETSGGALGLELRQSRCVEDRKLRRARGG